MHNKKGLATKDIITHITETRFKAGDNLTSYQKKRGEITDDMTCFFVPEEHLEIWTKNKEKGQALILKYKDRLKYIASTINGTEQISKYDL